MNQELSERPYYDRAREILIFVDRMEEQTRILEQDENLLMVVVALQNALDNLHPGIDLTEQQCRVFHDVFKEADMERTIPLAADEACNLIDRLEDADLNPEPSGFKELSEIIGSLEHS